MSEALICDGCEQRILGDYRTIEMGILAPEIGVKDVDLTLHVHVHPKAAVGVDHCREIVTEKIVQFVAQHVPTRTKGKK